MPVTFQVVGNLADFGNDPRAGVKVRATASPGVKVGDVAVHSNEPETVVTDAAGAFTLELVSLPGVWYTIRTPYSNAINTVRLAGYTPDVEDPTTGTEFPALTVINLRTVMDEDPTPGYEAINVSPTLAADGGAPDAAPLPIALRRGTTAQWATANPVLSAGEPGVDLTTGEQRIGNGTDPWSDLPSTGGGGVAVNALHHGVTADGVTNDAPAWNALLLALEGTGATITWSGTSMLDAPIAWKKGVSLIGQGWGQSVLATRGSTYFAAIEGFSPYATTASPFEDLLFKDFEVDGSGLTGTAANIGGKAIFMQFLRRCQFVNLYLHDTVGTALGTDFMPDCLIHGVLVVNGGRNWTGVEGGHAGIGIGTGAWPEENVTISDCHTVDCGHWGIFVEKQNEQPYHSRGAKIIGCSVTGTRGSGLADIGCVDTLIQGCSSTGNGALNNVDWRAGVSILTGSVGTRVKDCTISDNVGDGIAIRNDTGDGITVSGNKVVRNGRRGIVLSAAAATLKGITLRDNECAENQFDGINIGTTTGALPALVVSANRCYNNGKAGTAGADRGINIGATVDGGVINDNRCYDTATTKTQQYGLALPSGTFTNTVMVGNNLAGNNTAGMVTAGATLTSLTRRGNVGAASEANGTATIANGQSTVTVIHGLTAAPSTAVVTPRLNEALWVTTLGASGFIVNRVGTTGALDFSWFAAVA